MKAITLFSFLTFVSALRVYVQLRLLGCWPRKAYTSKCKLGDNRKLNAAITHFMTLLRCGVEDNVLSFILTSTNVTRRLESEGNKKNLKWTYNPASRKMSQLTEAAYKMWQELTDLVIWEHHSRTWHKNFKLKACT